MSNLVITCAGNLDSPLHFLSSQAVGSMLDPPKLAAYHKENLVRTLKDNHYNLRDFNQDACTFENGTSRTRYAL